MKITNYEIYKLKKSGLTNQQILKVLEYGENVDQELLLGDIADISGCRNPAVFMERYFQIDDVHLSKEFQKFPSFSILDDCYPWDLSEIYDAPVLLFYKGNLDLLKFPKVAVVGSRACSKQGDKSVEKSFKAWKMNWLLSVVWPRALTQQLIWQLFRMAEKPLQ